MFERRSEERFQREVLSHVNAAYNLARWLVGDPHDAEDAVQEATVRAFKGFTSLRGTDPKPWYLAIVRNTCMNLLKARNRMRDFEQEGDDCLADVPDRSEQPDKALERAYDASQLETAVNALPTSWREVIILREFEQLSYRELSEITAVPIGTVMSRLSRARARLFQLLSEETR